MKRLGLWGIFALICFCLVACGGSGSSSDTVTPDPGDTSTTGFTAEMLNDTYYLTESAGKAQEILVINGTGTGAATIKDPFEPNLETLSVNVTLNPDGTLTLLEVEYPGAYTITIIEETANYLYVKNVEDDGSGTWYEYWYFAKPAGWLSETSAEVSVPTPTPDGFTAEMLNDTYYVTYPGDSGGTTQETIVINGTGTGALTVTIDHFDASNVFVSGKTDTVNIILNQNGTLTATVTGVSGETTLTLVEETASYLYVEGVKGIDTWDDYWNFAKPADWLTADSGTPTGQCVGEVIAPLNLTIGAPLNQTIEAGGEKYYVFDVVDPATYTITLDNMATDNDWVLIEYLSNCEDDYPLDPPIIAESSNLSTTPDIKAVSLNPGEYLLIVDEWDELPSSYTLSVTR